MLNKLLRNNSITTGAEAEQAACRWLQQQGLETLTQNYRCRHGEIDLIMQQGEELVFVEVRFRKHQHFGGAIASVDRRKQQKLIRSAAYFLQQHPRLNNRPCRFDIMAASINRDHSLAAGRGDQHGNRLEWQWLQNAFC